MRRLGKGTIIFDNPPGIMSYASVVGKKEGEGPLAQLFDQIISDSYNGQDTYEDAESSLQSIAVRQALQKCGMTPQDMDVAFAGDLLNQCISSCFGLKDFSVPYLGQYGACSTMAQGLIMGSVFCESGAANHAICVTSSHFAAAQRQYRFPMEYGEVRTPTSQWTVTGAGAVILSGSENEKNAKVRIAAASPGRIVDMGIKDANNMGAAMAPAAAETISAFFGDTKTRPEDYDLIVTGDLGAVGSENLCELMNRDGFDISKNHFDCGLMIYDREKQNVDAGGSGCGCCASVLCSKLLGDMESGRLKNILFIATGALMSTTSAGQSKTIPSIAHLVNLKTVVE